jgi:hypothetical protein
MAGTTLRFPDQLKAEAQAYADTLGVSLNALCAIALRDYLDARKPEAVKPRDSVALPAKASSPSPRKVEAKLTPAQGPTAVQVPRVAANQPCPCGSGQKYKRCHGKP